MIYVLSDSVKHALEWAMRHGYRRTDIRVIVNEEDARQVPRGHDVTNVYRGDAQGEEYIQAWNALRNRGCKTVWDDAYRDEGGVIVETEPEPRSEILEWLDAELDRIMAEEVAGPQEPPQAAYSGYQRAPLTWTAATTPNVTWTGNTAVVWRHDYAATHNPHTHVVIKDVGV